MTNRTITLMTVWLISLALPAKAQPDIIGQVKEAIKAGSAKELSKFLNQTVDLTLEGNVQSYGKVQAEFVLRDFFKANPATDFTIIHQGSSKGGQLFVIGQYKSNTLTYQVFMKIKTVKNDQFVDDIRFTKEE